MRGYLPAGQADGGQHARISRIGAIIEKTLHESFLLGGCGFPAERKFIGVLKWIRL